MSSDERIGPFDANRPVLKYPKTGKIVTEGELRSYKENPRYWRDGDRRYQQWVDVLYERAYAPD